MKRYPCTFKHLDTKYATWDTKAIDTCKFHLVYCLLKQVKLHKLEIKKHWLKQGKEKRTNR
jgi:hypothetical protein